MGILHFFTSWLLLKWWGTRAVESIIFLIVEGSLRMVLRYCDIEGFSTTRASKIFLKWSFTTLWSYLIGTIDILKSKALMSASFLELSTLIDMSFVTFPYTFPTYSLLNFLSLTIDHSSSFLLTSTIILLDKIIIYLLDR